VNARPDVLAAPSCRDAARRILAAGLWCTVEVCTDIPGQVWEPRVVICRTDPDEALDAVADWVRDVPGVDARLAGYTRRRLRRARNTPVALCHVAGTELTLGGAGLVRR
jgi:hypothetical protein